MNNLILKPLILVAVLVVVRIPLEEMGAPAALTFLIGVTWLHFLVPIYLAFCIAGTESASPYKDLFKSIFLFTVYARLMVMVTYVLAYPLGLSAHRFSLEGGGGVGAETALEGMLIVPVRNFVLTVVVLPIIGMVLGSIVLLVKKRKMAG